MIYLFFLVADRFAVLASYLKVLSDYSLAKWFQRERMVRWQASLRKPTHNHGAQGTRFFIFSVADMGVYKEGRGGGPSKGYSSEGVPKSNFIGYKGGPFPCHPEHSSPGPDPTKFWKQDTDPKGSRRDRGLDTLFKSMYNICEPHGAFSFPRTINHWTMVGCVNTKNIRK